MPDETYQPKVYREQGGDRFVVKSGGEIDVESGGELKLAGVAITATAAELNAIAGGDLSAAELAVLDGVTPGTVTADKAVVVDSSKNIAELNDIKHAGVQRLSAGAAAAAIAQRYGISDTEGLEIRIIEETISAMSAAKTFDLTEDIPTGAVILSVQANIETLVVAGGTTVKIAIGVAGGDVDKYGKTANLSQNQKIDTIPTHAILSGAEDVQVAAVVTDGSALGDTNVSAGAVRVRIVYAITNSLDDA